MSDTEQNTQIEANIPMTPAPAGFPSFDSGISTDQGGGATPYPPAEPENCGDVPTNVIFGEAAPQPPIPVFQPELNLHYQHLIEQGQETDLPSNEKPAEVKIPTEFRVTPEEVEKAIASIHRAQLFDLSTGKPLGATTYIQLRNGYHTPSFPTISLPTALHGSDFELGKAIHPETEDQSRQHIWMLLGYQAMSRLNNYEYKVPKLAPGEEITREFLDEHYVSEKNISGHLAIEHTPEQPNPEIFNPYVRFPNARLAALVLKNGYTFFGIAQVVDIRNDVPSIGRSVAFEDAYRQLYQLAVYEQMEMAYQERLAAAQEASAT